MSERRRLRDVPFTNLDKSRKPYFLKEGVLSDVYGFTPYYTGGYRRSPVWSTHYQAPTGEVVIGCSMVGAIVPGGTPQITLATRKASANALFQYKILADGTGTPWAMLFGSSQDYNRTRIVYHRKCGKEFTLGWDVHAYNYRCHLFESSCTPVGAEPISISGITLTANSSGGSIPRGWVRVQLIRTGTFATPSVSEVRYGAPDILVKKDVQLTGAHGANSITVTNIPAATWPTTDYTFMYRTRVVADQRQLDFEPFYYCGSIAGSATTGVITNSDTQLLEAHKLDTGKFNFPGLGTAGLFRKNLQLGEHVGRLICSGVKEDYRLYISGYDNASGLSILDDNWWGYSLDTPERTPIIGWGHAGSAMIVLCEDALLRLNDVSASPGPTVAGGRSQSGWYFEKLANLGGINVAAVTEVEGVIYILGKDADDTYNIWECDGYHLKPVGDALKSVLTSNIGLLSIDGHVVTTNGYTGRYGEWGRLSVQAQGLSWSCGRNSTFRNGAPLAADGTRVYYRGSTFNAGSDYVITRDFTLMPEERSEWEKIFVFAEKISADVTLNVSARVDDASAWTSVATLIVNATTGYVAEVNLPPSVRHGKRLQIMLRANDANDVALEGITVQARAVPMLT